MSESEEVGIGCCEREEIPATVSSRRTYNITENKGYKAAHPI